MRFREENGYWEYTAYTNEVAADRRTHARSIVSEQPIVNCPDMMWGCSCNHVELLPGKLEYGNSVDSAVVSYDLTLRLRQKQLTARYNFDIYDVTNLDGVHGMSACFSGLAGALNLATDKKGSYPVRVPSKAVKADSTTIAGNFITFGIPRSPSVANYLSLMVVLNDGRKFNYEFEVTDQVRNAPDPLNVHIKIHGLELEKSEPGEASGAFNVDIDDWVNVVININS